MAWEWVAPSASGIVGVAGIAATYLTAKGARASQSESEQRTLDEARRRDLISRRQAVYSQFLATAREMQWLASAQEMLDDVFGALGLSPLDLAKQPGIHERIAVALQTHTTDPALMEDVRNATNAALMEAKSETADLYETRDWLRKHASLTALGEEVQLLAGPQVRALVLAVNFAIARTIVDKPRRPPEDQELVRKLPSLIGQLNLAMADEIRT